MIRTSIVAYVAFSALAVSAATVGVALYAVGDTKGASSLSPSSMTLTVGQSGSATMEQLANVSRTGYTLDSSGWRASRYNNNTFNESNRVFTATWCSNNATIDVATQPPQSGWTMLVVPVTPNPYTVTFSANGGSGTMSDQSFVYDEAKALAVNSFTRVGHAFSGWNYGGRTYADGEVVSNLTTTAGGVLAFTAVWSVNSYTITLDAGEADTPGTESVQAEYGRTFPSITLPTRYGYYFRGYFTQREGGGEQCYLSNGNPCTSYLSSNATIYAKWEEIPVYNVTFLTLGGTFTNGWTTETNYMAGTSLTLPTALDIHRDSKTFAGWYLDDDYSFTNRVYSITHLDTGNRTFKARWLGKSYTVDFQANGGVGHKTQAFEMGESQPLLSLSETQIRREGYSFREWNRAADGSGDHFSDGAMIDDNLTDTDGDVVYFYAQWTNNVYTVTFQPNGADGGETMPNQSFVYDVTQNLNAVEFTYTGRSFEKWSSDTNYNYRTLYYADGEAVANLATGGVANLYAKWTNNVYTVSFDANGGTGAMDPITCTYTVPTNLPFCTFERDGWGFKGWTNSLAEGVLFADHARVTNLTARAEEVQMYACWTGSTYSVVFDTLGEGVMTNGFAEEVSVLTNFYVVGDAWDNFPVPANVDTQHWDFAGWTYVDAQGVTKPIPAEVPPRSTGTTNLVAAWSWKVDDLAAAVDATNLAFSTFGTVGGRGRPTESSANYNWFAQANFVHGSTNAAQSADLPVNTADSKVYVSWLTTTVETNGVLSFWWKCDAPPLQEAPYQQYALKPEWCGNSFTFGLYDSTEGITNIVAQLTDHADWDCVVYTNTSDSSVTFAWAFAYADYDGHNGGGTGWVDRVTWKLEGSVSVEVTSKHAVPFSWLREKFPAYESADATALETLAESDSPNGKPMKVWQEYWAGTNPNDLDDLFRAYIAVSNDVAHITWRPDLSVTGVPVRVYHVLSAPSLTSDWQKVLENVEEEAEVDLTAPGAPAKRFFKVELDWEDSREE